MLELPRAQSSDPGQLGPLQALLPGTPKYCSSSLPSGPARPPRLRGSGGPTTCGGRRGRAPAQPLEPARLPAPRRAATTSPPPAGHREPGHRRAHTDLTPPPGARQKRAKAAGRVFRAPAHPPRGLTSFRSAPSSMPRRFSWDIPPPPPLPLLLLLLPTQQREAGAARRGPTLRSGPAPLRPARAPGSAAAARRFPPPRPAPPAPPTQRSRRRHWLLALGGTARPRPAHPCAGAAPPPRRRGGGSRLSRRDALRGLLHEGGHPPPPPGRLHPGTPQPVPARGRSGCTSSRWGAGLRSTSGTGPSPHRTWGEIPP